MKHIIYSNHGTIQETTVATEELFETLQFLNSNGYQVIRVESADNVVIPLPVHRSVA